MLARARAAAQVLNDLAGLKRGSLTIAASQTVANYWLPSRIQAFRMAHPDIDLHISIANTEQVARAVHEGSADLGFVEGEVDNASLAISRIDGDSLVVVVGMKHPWVGRAKITPKDLLTTAWVLREPGSGTRSMFEAALRKYGIRFSDLRVALSFLQRSRARRCSNPVIAPPRFRTLSSRNRLPPGPCTASKSICLDARFTSCGTRNATPAMSKRP